ncbi:MAG TPA: sterol desaturase family protein [Roseiarcus sp.]|jgi:sterol desaturase/sphingolipid hydroxylase (fatty acid hydroxylase superfamily)
MQTLTVILLIVAMIAFARILERRWPIAVTPVSESIEDWKLVSINLVLTTLLAPITTVSSGIILSTLGHGWIRLPTDGYWYFVSIIILAVISDLYTYIFHRLQHAVPFLWAMHSFHHSANSLTFVTGARHLWMERVMSSAVLPIIPILFQVPPDMQIIVSLIHFFPDTCAHLNVRFPMGRMITVLNSPQWHRIHHSVMPEHRDKNFASLLPLWDILFGTAWIPKPDEYPVTGLDPPVRVSALEGVIWPFRHLRLPTKRIATPEVAGDRPAAPAVWNPDRSSIHSRGAGQDGERQFFRLN